MVFKTKGFTAHTEGNTAGRKTLSAPTGAILTLQEVRDQQGGRVVAAGQTFLRQVPLDLQRKQVPESEPQLGVTNTTSAPEKTVRQGLAESRIL